MDTFAVIADPTRRTMLDMLAAGPLPAGAMVEAFPSVSQPAISQHLKVLRESGLATVTADRQRRIYALNVEGLTAIRAWLDGLPGAKVPEPVALVKDIPAPESEAKPKPKTKAPRREGAEALMGDLFG